MTREEAINHIKYGLIEGNYPLPKEIGIEALNMAIKALEQPTVAKNATVEQSGNSEELDCISREPSIPNDSSGLEKNSKKLEKDFGEFDCISRKELLKAIATWDRFGLDDTNHLFRLDNLSSPHYVPYIHYDDVIKCIKGMPSVNPQEPRKGHWIMLPIMTHECSNCGIRKDYELEWNYCPNCGCRMESEDN